MIFPYTQNGFVTSDSLSFRFERDDEILKQNSKCKVKDELYVSHQNQMKLIRLKTLQEDIIIHVGNYRVTWNSAIPCWNLQI